MRDKPRDAKWLDAREAEAVEAAIAAEQAKIKPAGGYLKAMTSRNVLLLSVQYFLWSLGIYGFVFWLPSIVSAGATVRHRPHRPDLRHPVRLAPRS